MRDVSATGLRYALAPKPDGSFALEQADGKGAFKPFLTIPADDALTTIG